MKHNINLFQADLIPERPWLTLPRLLIILLIIVGILLLLNGYSSLQLRQLNAELQQQTNIRSELQNKSTQLTRQIAGLRADPRLESQVMALDAEIRIRQSLIAEFQRRGQMTRQDYAGLLTDLARIDYEGLWLTRIQQRQGQIRLHGLTVDAGYLPTWMQDFNKSPMLSQRQFNMVTLKRDQQQLLSFELLGTPANMVRVEMTDQAAVSTSSSHLQEERQ